MYYLKRLWPALCVTTAMLTACDIEEQPPERVEEKLPPDVEQARAYFNDYASQEVEYQLIGMHPGAIAAQWDDVTVIQRDDMTVYNVGLFTEARYSGSFYIDPEAQGETYSTAIFQRLVVCRYPEGHYACFLASIIPGPELATMNRDRIGEMFMCGDNGERGFSGIVMYSTVTTNYTVMLEVYKDGQGVKQLSVYAPYDDYSALMDEMRRVIGPKNISRELVATSRSGGEFGSGITLPNIDVPGYGGGGSNTGGGVPTLPTPPDPPFPDPWGNRPPNPPVTPPGYDRPGNGNTGGGGNSNNGSTIKPSEYKKSDSDKLIRPNIEDIEVNEQAGNSCVTASMTTIARILGTPVNQMIFDNYYVEMCCSYGYNILEAIKLSNNGVANFNHEENLVKHFFETRIFVGMYEALNANYPVLATIPSGVGDYHCVVAVGYTKNREIIYIDPAPNKNKFYTAPLSYFINHNITITKLKKL